MAGRQVTVNISDEEMVEIGEAQEILGGIDLDDYVRRAAIYYARFPLGAMVVSPGSTTPAVWEGEEPAWVIAYRDSYKSEVSAPTQLAPPIITSSPVESLSQTTPHVIDPRLAAKLLAYWSRTPGAEVTSPTSPIDVQPTPPASLSPPPLAPTIRADELASLREAERNLLPEERFVLVQLREQNGEDVPTGDIGDVFVARFPRLRKTPRSVCYRLKVLGLAENMGKRRTYRARIIPGLWEPEAHSLPHEHQAGS